MEASLIYKYFPDLSSQQKNQIEQLFPLYNNWNEKINVVSRKDIDQLYERHVLHSLAVAKFIGFQPGSDILDLGTGGGFPGIPLAIIYPSARFHLVDSINKKITVVKAVSEELGLQNLTAEHLRVEKVKGKYDFIISRAVAKTKLLANWTNQKIKEESRHSKDNGLILLKGGDLNEEMKDYGKPYTQTRLSNYFKESFFETKYIIHVPIQRS